MPLYKNYEHCREVVQSLLPLLSVEGRKKMEYALTVSRLFMHRKPQEPKEATKFLNDKLFRELFDIPEAVEEGFSQYIQRYSKELDRFNAYHKKNCKGKGCELCLKTQTM